MFVSSDLIERLEAEYETLPNPETEIIQHLQELGYLRREIDVEAFTSVQKTKAKKAFKKDIYLSGLLSQKGNKPSGDEMDEESFLLHSTRQATDIDEGFRFKKLPEIGSVTLISRIIHYRLELFGLWDNLPIESPYSVTTLFKLRTLEEYVDLSALDCINQLADIEGFTYRLLEERPPEDFILTFKGKKLEGEEFKKLERRRAFGRQLVDEFGEKNEFIKKLRKTILKENENKIDYLFLKKESKHEFKQFVLRLIQVHQWQEGFYDGLLDSSMGDATINSLVEAINAHNESNGTDIKLHRAITYLDDGFYMFNGLFFLKQYMVENEGHNPSKLWEELGNQVSDATPEERDGFNANLSQIKQQLVSGSDKPESKKGFFKRVYCGVKKVLQKAMALVKKFFKFVLTKLKQLGQFLTKVFKIFYEHLRFGIKAFVDGMKFLLGRKLVVSSNEEHFVISTFGLDGDCMNLANGSDPSLVKEHRHKTGYFFGSMFFAIKLVQGVIQLLIRATNILSWPLLLIKIVQVAKGLIEEYKELRLDYAAIQQ